MDSSGKLCMVLAACLPVFSKKVGRHHVRRSLEEPDLFDLWGFDDIPVGQFDPETTQTTVRKLQLKCFNLKKIWLNKL